MIASAQSPDRQERVTLSPALRFLLAGDQAMPRTLSKGERSSALNDLMRIAIDCRMAFGRSEGPLLRRLDYRSCAGVFRTLDERWYSHACRAGSPYAALWEAQFNHKPWIAPDVFIGPLGRDASEQARNNRVAPDMALLLRSDDTDDDPGRPIFTGGFEVWWCTSLDVKADTITLCRYWLPPDRRHPLTRRGQPRRRRVLDRVAWAELFPPPAPRRTASAEHRGAA